MVYLLSGVFGVSLWADLERVLNERGISVTLPPLLISCMAGKQKFVCCLFICYSVCLFIWFICLFVGGTAIGVIISVWNVIV